MAVKAGASGVLGGRAFWKEFFTHDTAEARRKFAEQEAADRVAQIHKIVLTQATPWFARYGLGVQQLGQMRATENWHFRYGGAGAGGKASKAAEGEVY